MWLTNTINYADTDSVTTQRALNGAAEIFFNISIIEVDTLFLINTNNKTKTTKYIESIQLNGGNITNILPYDI